MAASNSASQGVGYVPYPPPPVECLMQLIVNGKPVGPRIPFGRSFSVQKEDVRHIAIRCFPPDLKWVLVITTIIVSIILSTMPIFVITIKYDFIFSHKQMRGDHDGVRIRD